MSSVGTALLAAVSQNATWEQKPDGCIPDQTGLEIFGGSKKYLSVTSLLSVLFTSKLSFPSDIRPC